MPKENENENNENLDAGGAGANGESGTPSGKEEAGTFSVSKESYDKLVSDNEKLSKQNKDFFSEMKQAKANAQSEKEELAKDSGNSDAVIKILEEKIAARDEVIGGYTEKHEQEVQKMRDGENHEFLDEAMGDAKFLDPEFAEIVIQKNPEYFERDEDGNLKSGKDGVQLLAEKIKKEKAHWLSEKELPSQEAASGTAKGDLDLSKLSEEDRWALMENN